MLTDAPQRGLRGRPTPRPVESQFGIDEVFFSTTDPKGIIRSGNRVFVRISKYARHELVGSPHNIIRHPDMPRIVFKLLWEEIQAGRPIAAYVKNMAKDGSFYWVLATIVPCAGGYLSVRIKPSTPYFETVKSVYDDLLALERQVEDGNPKRREASMEASRARLLEHLSAVGFASYEAFMRTILLAEVRGRDAAWARPALATRAGATEDQEALRAVLVACEALDRFLGMLVGRIDAYAELNQQLAHEANLALDLAEDVQLFSLNARLAANRVNDTARTLEAVSSLMQRRSEEGAPIFRSLVEDVVGSADLLDSMLLPVGIARIQAQASLGFMRELLDSEGDERATADDLGALAQCLAGEVAFLTTSLTELDGRLRQLRSRVGELLRELSVMRALELNGRIEASYVAQAGEVVSLFRTIAQRIEGARVELDDLARASRFSLAAEVREAELSQRHLATIRERVAVLASA